MTMHVSPNRHPSRRTFLALGVSAALATAVFDAGPAFADTGISAQLRKLEAEHRARLGVFAGNTVTRKTVTYRADELFPMCSVFKTLAVAAVLRDFDQNGEFLARRIHYTNADVTSSGYAPITGRPEHLANGMTVAELCEAAICYSDNTAANLLLRELDGPATVTRFARSVGDEVTRLDRWEPDLNSGEPGRIEDTTSPRAIGNTYARLVLGNALQPADRSQLIAWLQGNTTGAQTLRAGLPKSWILGDKTGSGGYGTRNDVGIAWTPQGAPVVLAVLSTHADADAKPDDLLVADTAKLLTTVLA